MRRRARRSAQTLEAMDRAVLIWMSAVLAAVFIALDLWFAASRCAASPPLYPTGMAIGGVSQVLCISMPIVLARHFSTESLRFHLRGLGLALLLAVSSVPVLLASLLYSDAIGKEKAYRSVGFECHGPALTPRNGF
jgi:hypothetical protein